MCTQWVLKQHCLFSDILGEQADIHTGGVDLKFPHHDNEIAQAEVHESVPVITDEITLICTGSLWSRSMDVLFPSFWSPDHRGM